MNRRVPKAKKTAVNKRMGIEMVKTLLWGLQGSTKMVKFLFVSMGSPSLYQGEDNPPPRIFF